MKQTEADELKKLIDSFVEFDIQEVKVEEVTKEPIELSPENLMALFRNEIPEGFDINNAKFIRSPKSGDRGFLVHGEERRWIPDLETLEAIGYGLDDIKDVTDEELDRYKERFGLLTSKLWKK
jgi:hypothetical protein